MRYIVTVAKEDGEVVESFKTVDMDNGILNESPMFQARSALNNASDLADIGANDWEE